MHATVHIFSSPSTSSCIGLKMPGLSSHHFLYLSHPKLMTMECGGVIAEGGLKMPGLSSQVEESEIMDHLLGILSSGDESHQELPCSIQASNASYFHYNASSSASRFISSNDSGNLSLVVPSEYGSYYMSDSNEALSFNSCTAPLHLNVEEQGVAQFMKAILNPSYGSSNSSCGDLEDSSLHFLDSTGTSVKREYSEQGKPNDQMRSRKCARNSDSKRVKKIMRQEGEDVTVALENRQSLTCCTSENRSDDSHEPPVAANLNGKAQADRRSAIESQSLYARKRRDRINERLRVLQNLVPNGTKVDIGTMLEEAVQYVKFLQLQIKLLSSDEMWMYAPIAYNGMNIGVDANLCQQ